MHQPYIYPDDEEATETDWWGFKPPRQCAPEPKKTKNNDGQDVCVFCGAPTRKCSGFDLRKDYRICTICKK